MFLSFLFDARIGHEAGYRSRSQDVELLSSATISFSSTSSAPAVESPPASSLSLLSSSSSPVRVVDKVSAEKTTAGSNSEIALDSISAFGASRAVHDLQLDLSKCRFMHMTPRPQPGKKCETSATCALGQFCHPERKMCGDFCQPPRPGSKSPPERLKPRPKDVWLVSFPKSGSTWLRHLIWNLHRFETQRRKSLGGNVDQAFEPDRPSTFSEVDEGIPFLEDRATGPIRSIFKEKEGLRIFKSHQPYSCDVPPCRGWVVSRQAKWQCGCPNCASKFRRVIYIVRDGRPTMASYWKFQGQLHLKGYRKVFGDFLSLKQRRYPGVSWSDHVRSWMSARR